METRNTIQKQTILQAVKQLANHPTAEQVYEQVVQRLPNISRATVYRNLSSMAERGMLRRIGVPGGADHYDHTLEDHHHILCSDCGALEDIWMELPTQHLQQVAQSQSQFAIEGCQLVFYGRCPACQSKSEDAEIPHLH